MTVLRDSTDSGNVVYRGIAMEGRAEYAEEGEDIVCAAVPALALNFFNSVETFTEDEFEGGAGQGNMQLEFRFTSEIGPELKLPVDSLTPGLRNIERDYRKSYINVRYREV